MGRTVWGDPDLQGTWDFTTITPLQRPSELAGREFLTENEAAAIEKQINQQRVQTEDTSPGSLGGGRRPESDPGIYNLGWWWEPNGRRLVRTRRTSLVVDPPDGRIPPLTAQAQTIPRARDEAARARPAAGRSPTGRTLHHGIQLGSTDGARALQQSGPDLSKSRIRGDRQRDGARRAHRPSRWPPASWATRFDSGRATRAAVGKATRSSSRRETSPTTGPARSGFPD